MQKRREIASSDPMPTRIEPCLALLVPRPPKGEGWAYEVKWDGYRLAINVDQVRSKVLTRNGHDWTSRFQHLADAAAKLGHNTMILDGEGVVLDAKGRSDFSMLQKALGGRGGRRFAHEAVFFAFDILYLDGRDLRSMPLSERRELLKQVISDDQTGTIRLSEEVDAAGVEFFKIACEHGLEGIVAKRLDAPYRSGRHGEWQKIKCVQSESFQIVGYEPSDAWSYRTTAIGGSQGREARLRWRSWNGFQTQRGTRSQIAPRPDSGRETSSSLEAQERSLRSADLCS